MTSRGLILFAVAVIGVPISCSGQTVPSADAIYPDSTWMQYASPDEAGWSSEAIETVQHFADSLGARAVMLVHGGAIVTEWGWTRDPAPVRSIRKSLVSALLGIAVEEETIDTTATIADLGIDDTPPLLDIEKQARVIDLLTTSSGVYHEAAAEPAGMRKPERGSAIPGETWYYNNWDFNVLGTIYEQETGMRIFEAFERRIAIPIGMEHFTESSGSYALQPNRSEHPAYQVWMTARDLARFGLLYLREGRWRGRQIVPQDWVRASGQIYKAVPYGGVAGYGLSWWIPDGPLQEYGTYSASGSGNQSIMILPALDIVFVFRASAVLDDGVNGLDAREILLRLIGARTGVPKDDPVLVPVTD